MQEVLWIMRCEWIERCWQIVCSIQGSANLLLDLLVPMHSTQYNVPCFGWEHIRFHESKRVQILQMSNHHTDAFPRKNFDFLEAASSRYGWLCEESPNFQYLSINFHLAGLPLAEKHRIPALVSASLSARIWKNQHGRGDSGNSKASNQRAGHSGTTMLMVYLLYLYIYIYISTGIEIFGVNYEILFYLSSSIKWINWDIWFSYFYCVFCMLRYVKVMFMVYHRLFSGFVEGDFTFRNGKTHPSLASGLLPRHRSKNIYILYTYRYMFIHA